MCVYMYKTYIPVYICMKHIYVYICIKMHVYICVKCMFICILNTYKMGNVWQVHGSMPGTYKDFSNK